MDVGRALLLLLAGLLAACTPDPPPDRAGRPALWEITGPDGAGGWIFGSVHALPDDVAWWTPALESALARADSLVLEIADAAPAAEARRLFLGLARTPGLPPLGERVASERRDALRQALDRAGLDAAQLRPLEDWAAALTLSLALDAHHGFVTANGVEPALRARAGKRPLLGLETAASQLAVFDTLPASAQRALLEAVIAASDDGDQGRRLVAAWLAGDLAAIEREAEAGMLADPALREALLLKRNRAWAHRVAALLRGGRRPFVAVGAAHLAGSQGLPALLAAQGFALRRVQ